MDLSRTHRLELLKDLQSHLERGNLTLPNNLGLPFARVGAEQLSVSASLGNSLCPDHGRAPDLLIRLADRAMYMDKQAGRTNARIYHPGTGRWCRPAGPETARLDLPIPGIARLARAVASGRESWLNWPS